MRVVLGYFLQSQLPTGYNFIKLGNKGACDPGFLSLSAAGLGSKLTFFHMSQNRAIFVTNAPLKIVAPKRRKLAIFGEVDRDRIFLTMRVVSGHFL